MDPELLRLLLEVLRNQQTTGSAETGGTWPYDDYGLQNTIGGIGAAKPDGGGAFADGSIEGATGNPTRYDTSPSTVGFYGPQARIEQRQPLADLLAQMQQGVGAGPAQPALSGLFGSTPTLQRPRPQVTPVTPVTPVAAPVAGTAQPPPKGTPTPDPRRDASTLPRKPEKSKQVQLRAPQAAQQITRQAVAAQPQRQYSAPAPQRQYSAPAPVYTPAFTPAPASRAAAQNSLAQTLNTMRSLNRR